MSSDDTDGQALGQPPSTAPPPSVRAAILAAVVQKSVGSRESPLLDGRYRLLEEIGRGGAGTVWKAELLPLGRLVAVKLLRSTVASDRKAVSRLVREAMTVSKLGHEHIVQVNDVGMDEHGSAYIAMELLEGESLAQWIGRRGPLPWADVAELATQLCDALSAAHEVGVVHRDIKPANVFATKRSDGRWRCKLLDFGLCTGGFGTSLPLTAAGVRLGTPGYAAPEQLRGDAVDGRADLYGLSCIMVELLTGHPAFEGATGQERVANQLAGRRSAHAQQLPAEVLSLLDRGLSLDPTARHDSPAAFARAIAAVRPHVPPPPTRRRQYVGGFAVLAVTSALAVAAWRPSAANSAHRLDPPARPTLAMPAPTTPPPLEASPQPRPAVAIAEPPRAAPSAPRRRTAPKRQRSPKPPPKPEPREYPEGIRDPFAAR